MYEAGDGLKHEDVNYMLDGVRQLLGDGPPSQSNDGVPVLSHIDLTKFSVFGVGSTANAYSEIPVVALSNPLSDSSGFVYTNRDTFVVASVASRGWPILGDPEKLRTDGTIVAGNLCGVDDQGRAVAGGSLLKAVTDSSGGFAWFIAAVSGGNVDEKPNGFFNCCICQNPELHVSIEGDGITWEHVRNDLWPVKSSGGLLHKIILTSDDDPAVTREIELPLVDCSEIDCHVQDMTGEFVGAREIESIIFGNSATCSVFCDPAPAISYLEETFAALPASPWSISLDESSVASNIMTFTAQDSFSATFQPAVATQVFHMLVRFRILSDSMQISVKGIDYVFADDGSWSASSGVGSVVTGIGTPGATVELLIVDNVVTIDGSASKDLSVSTLSGSCGTSIAVLFDTDVGFPPVVGTDVAEIDVLEVGWR